MTDKPEQCPQRVVDDYGPHQCKRRGVVREEGKLWCKQHAPSAVEARRKTAEELFCRQSEDNKRFKREAAWATVLRELEVNDPKLHRQLDSLWERLRGGG